MNETKVFCAMHNRIMAYPLTLLEEAVIQDLSRQSS